MTQLISLPEIKDFLSIKSANVEEDGRLSNIAVQVSSLVTSYCGREFLANTYTEYFDGGRASVFIANPPINYVSEVAHFDGREYLLLGGPNASGQPIIKEGAAHYITMYGNPLVKTRVKKFGRSSLRLDGASYLTASSNEDWDLGVDDFTVELYARFDSLSGMQTLVRSGNANSYWSFGVDFNSNGLIFNVVENGNEICNVSQASTTSYSANQFYHLAVSRNSTGFYLAKEGSILTTQSNSVSIPNYETGVDIGKYMTGYIDNLRITHDARYVSSYTTAGYPPATDEDTKLLLRFDGSNDTTSFADLSRTVNEFAFYPVTGEITFDTGDGGGTPELSFFRPLKFRNYPNGVRVIYNGGFLTIPDDLKLAVLEMIKVIYKGRGGSERVSFQGESTWSHRLSIDDFPPQVRRVMNLYRLIN
jgi:hypothetical protein